MRFASGIGRREWRAPVDRARRLNSTEIITMHQSTHESNLTELPGRNLHFTGSEQKRLSIACLLFWQRTMCAVSGGTDNNCAQTNIVTFKRTHRMIAAEAATYRIRG
jgi:hypothetical protein